MRPSWGNRAVFCIGLLLWASRLAPVKTEYSLGFWPLHLLRTEGENATFVCNVSHKSSVPILNWYREKNGSQPEKLAAYPKDTPSSQLQERYHIAMRADKQTYEMTILGLQLNDSGRYFCGIINFEMPPVEESDRSELNVTGADNSQSDKDCLSLKKADPPVVSVSTVVYGQLEFQRTEVPKRGGADSSEQTEYATIVFPAEKPAFYSSSPHGKSQAPRTLIGLHQPGALPLCAAILDVVELLEAKAEVLARP
ncbi:programmed cell death protein 1 isoform X3 [Petaurus breviceps papuanus]|uniref:programmed cell death protein 1 isoform X3 n=1 Tax=Petaurus breviceps papuanus TaxID=3040969 RepID=UPI0036DC0365